MIRHATATALLCLTITGCGGGDSASPTSADGPVVDCRDPNLPQGVWVENCQASRGPEPDPAPTMQVRKVGEGFSYLNTPVDGTPTQWTITVTSIKCGVTPYGNPVGMAPAYCRVEGTAANVGRTPGRPQDFDDLLLATGQYTQTGDDDTKSGEMGQYANRQQFEFNPGQTMRMVKVWSAPLDAKPVGVLFPFETVYAGPSVRVEL